MSRLKPRTTFLSFVIARNVSDEAILERVVREIASPSARKDILIGAGADAPAYPCFNSYLQGTSHMNHTSARRISVPFV